jgi:hypothetical protein
MSQHKMRILLVITITMVMSVGLIARSVAAQPLNDYFANAFVISGPGFTDSGSAADATESPDDPAIALGSFCGGGNTVWYSFTPAADTRLIIDTFGSDYYTSLGVYTGSLGSFSEVACGENSVVFDAAAGVTYGVVIGTCCYSGNLYGGNYVISVTEAPPPFALDITIDRGSVNKVTGTATITGKVTCNTPGYYDLYITLEQRSGKFVTRGQSYTSGGCEGVTAFSVTIRPDGQVAFKSGRAGVTADVYGCDPYTCDDAHLQTTIKL